MSHMNSNLIIRPMADAIPVRLSIPYSHGTSLLLPSKEIRASIQFQGGGEAMATGGWGPWDSDMLVSEMMASIVGAVYAGEQDMLAHAVSVAAACRAAFVCDCDDFESMSDIDMARAFRVGAGDLGPGLMNLVCKRFTARGQPAHRPPPAFLPEMVEAEGTAAVVQTKQPPKFGREGKYRDIRRDIT